MKEKLQLKGKKYCLQEWVKCQNINNVKYTSNSDIKNNKTKIFRSKKLISLLY